MSFYDPHREFSFHAEVGSCANSGVEWSPPKVMAKPLIAIFGAREIQEIICVYGGSRCLIDAMSWRDKAFVDLWFGTAKKHVAWGFVSQLRTENVWRTKSKMTSTIATFVPFG